MNQRALHMVDEIIQFIDGNHPTIISDDLTEPSVNVRRVILADAATGQELEVEFRAN